MSAPGIRFSALMLILIVGGACGRESTTPVTPTSGAVTLEASPKPYDVGDNLYGEPPAVASPEAQTTVAAIHRLGSAIEAYEDEFDSYPEANQVGDLEASLVPRFIDSLPLTDGWGRPFELSRVNGDLEVRSLGADGVRDDGDARGAVSDPGADIVYRGEGFVQWPAVAR